MSIIKVVMVEPRKPARIEEIDNSLGSMQKIVGGYIELFYPFADENICCVCNEEGKLNGLELNRAIYDEDGRIADIIAGVFFICDASEAELGSLSPEQLEQLTERYRLPEMICSINDQIVAIPYESDEGDVDDD